MDQLPDTDVRTRGFSQCANVADALAWLDRAIGDRVNACTTEQVPLNKAAGRVLADDVAARGNVPAFQRAMMDGFAVHVEDLAGASPSSPRPLNEIGVTLPGQMFSGEVGRGEAVRIMTGAPMPIGADAVLPFEMTAPSDQDAPVDRRQFVLAVAEIAKGRNVGRIGEDIQAGETVLRKGRALRPQDVGVLSSIGVAGVAVRRQPRVALVVTGNELLAAGETPHGCRIADANGPMLAALTARDGGELLPNAIIPDDREAIRQAMRADAHIVLVSGGSSCGQEDHAPSILDNEGDLAIHGISMKPARPTGMGTLGDRMVFLLPGNPVACLFAYDLFAGRAIRALGGRPSNWPYRRIPARLSRDTKSEVGRVDYLRVRIVDHDKSGDGKEPTLIEPVPQSGASVLSSTVRADGFVLVPAERAASAAGEDVSLYLYDADWPR